MLWLTREDEGLAWHLPAQRRALAGAGIPAISIPCGQTSDGLPIGLQLQAPAFAEVRLLQTAQLAEKVLEESAL